MDAKYDLSGQTIGRLTVLGLAPSQKAGDGKQWHRAWFVRCSCGTEKIVKGSDMRRRNRQGTVSCGCQRRSQASYRAKQTGDKHWGWKGGLSKQPNGYMRHSRVKLVDGSEAVNRFEHSVVMEFHLGRRLLPGENVHHKNGVRHDNRIENLELWVDHQPPGQRVEDIVAHAKMILRRYEPSALKEDACLSG